MSIKWAIGCTITIQVMTQILEVQGVFNLNELQKTQKELDENLQDKTVEISSMRTEQIVNTIQWYSTQQTPKEFDEFNEKLTKLLSKCRLYVESSSRLLSAIIVANTVPTNYLTVVYEVQTQARKFLAKLSKCIEVFKIHLTKMQNDKELYIKAKENAFTSTKNQVDIQLEIHQNNTLEIGKKIQALIEEVLYVEIPSISKQYLPPEEEKEISAKMEEAYHKIMGDQLRFLHIGNVDLAMRKAHEMFESWKNLLLEAHIPPSSIQKIIYELYAETFLYIETTRTGKGSPSIRK